MAASDESCDGNPDFAVICSFITKFGNDCGVNVTIADLQQMLEDTKNVHEDLAELHIHLLRRGRKRVTKEKWERSLIKFCHEYSSVDAWELERFGYKKAKLSVKLELLKRLLELQFDSNAKFKSEVNKHEAHSLRIPPIGRDIDGQVYWYQLDREYNMRLYRQGPEEDGTWKLLCSNTDHLKNLLANLQKNITKDLLPEDILKVSPDEVDSTALKMETDGDDLTSRMSETKPNTIIIKSEKKDATSSTATADPAKPPLKGNDEITLIENESNLPSKASPTDQEIKPDKDQDKEMDVTEVVVKKEVSSTPEEGPTPMEVDDCKREKSGCEKALDVSSKSDIEMSDAEQITDTKKPQLSPVEKDTSKSSQGDSKTIEKHLMYTDNSSISNHPSTKSIPVAEQSTPKDPLIKPSTDKASPRETKYSPSKDVTAPSDVTSNAEQIEAKYKGGKIKLYEKWSKQKKLAAAADAKQSLKSVTHQQQKGGKAVEKSSDSALSKSKSPILSSGTSQSEEVPMDLSVSFRSDDTPSKGTTEIAASDLSNSKKASISEKTSRNHVSIGEKHPLQPSPEKKSSDNASVTPRPFKKKHSSVPVEETTSDLSRKSVIFEVKSNKLLNQFQESSSDSTKKDAISTNSGFSHLQALQNMCNENPMTFFQSSVIRSGSPDKRLKSESGLPDFSPNSSEKSSYNEANCDNISQKYKFSSSQLSGDVKHFSENDVPPLLLKSNVHSDSDIASKETSPQQKSSTVFKSSEMQDSINNSSRNISPSVSENLDKQLKDAECSERVSIVTSGKRSPQLLKADSEKNSTFKKHPRINDHSVASIMEREYKEVSKPNLNESSDKCDNIKEIAGDISKSSLQTTDRDKIVATDKALNCFDKKSETVLPQKNSPQDLSENTAKVDKSIDSETIKTNLDVTKVASTQISSEKTTTKVESSISVDTELKSTKIIGNEEADTSCNADKTKLGKDSLVQSNTSSTKVESGSTTLKTQSVSDSKSLPCETDRTCDTAKSKDLDCNKSEKKKCPTVASDSEQPDVSSISKKSEESKDIKTEVVSNKITKGNAAIDNSISFTLSPNKSDEKSTGSIDCKNAPEKESKDLHIAVESRTDKVDVATSNEIKDKTCEEKNVPSLEIASVKTDPEACEEVGKSRLQKTDSKIEKPSLVPEYCGTPAEPSKSIRDSGKKVYDKHSIANIIDKKESEHKLTTNGKVGPKKEAKEPNGSSQTESLSPEVENCSKQIKLGSKNEVAKLSKEESQEGELETLAKDKVSKKKDCAPIEETNVSVKVDVDKGKLKEKLSKDKEKHPDSVKTDSNPSTGDTLSVPSAEETCIKAESEIACVDVPTSPKKHTKSKTLEATKQVTNSKQETQDVTLSKIDSEKESISEKSIEIVKGSPSETASISKDLTTNTMDENKSKTTEMSKEKLEVSKEKLEVSKEKLEVSQEKLQVSEEKLEVSKGKSEVSKEKMEVSKEKLEVSKGKSEVSKGKSEVSKEKSEVPKEKSEVSKEKLEVSKEKLEVSKEKLEVSKGKSEVSKEKLEVSKEKLEVSKGKSEVSKEKLEVSKGKSEVSKEKSEVSKEKSEVSKEKLEVSKEKLKVSKEKLEVSKEKLEVSKGKSEVSKEKSEVSKEKLEVSKEKLEVSSKEITEPRYSETSSDKKAIEKPLESKETHEDKSAILAAESSVEENEKAKISIDDAKDKENKESVATGEADDKENASLITKCHVEAEMEIPKKHGAESEDISEIIPEKGECNIKKKNSAKTTKDSKRKLSKSASKLKEQKTSPESLKKLERKDKADYSKSPKNDKKCKDVKNVVSTDITNEDNCVDSSIGDKEKEPLSKEVPEKSEAISIDSSKKKSGVSLKTKIKINIKDPLGVYFVLHNACLESKMRHPSFENLKKIPPPSLKSKPKLITTFSMDTTDDVQIIQTMIDTSPTKKKRGRLRQSKNTTPAESKATPTKTNSKSSPKTPTSSKKATIAVSDEKDGFHIPEGFLEILSNTQSDGSSAKKETQRKPRGRKLKISTPSLENSESESAPIKRSRRIQDIQQKKMSELAVEMEREQRILEQLAKKSVKKDVPQKSPIKAKEAKLSRSPKPKFQPPAPEESASNTCLESKRTPRKMNSRSRNMTKMHLLYEDESKDSEFSTSRETEKSKKRRRGRGNGKKGFKPWDVSSESESTLEELTEEEEEEEHEEVLVFEVNEDEFACEEVEEDAEPIVVRRARTAKKIPEDANVEEIVVADDKPCLKCGKHDKPEWILLCDKCDSGYHMTCLIPPLILIPEGDWYCQPCEHIFLCEWIQKELHKLEVVLKQREREELRKQRLAYVGISLDNVLKPEKKEKSDESSGEDDKEEDESEEEDSRDVKSSRRRDRDSSSEEDRHKKLYGKRSVRARRTVNYQFKEYDELIASAIGDELVDVKLPEEAAAGPKEVDDDEENDSDKAFQAKFPKQKKRKTTRLNDLDFSDDEDSGEEYKRSSGSDSEQTPPPSVSGSDGGSAASGEWRVVKTKGKKPKKKKKRGRRDDSEEDWDDEDDSDTYRPITRRAAQKSISYREISSDDEWDPKPKAVKKRKKFTSSEDSEASYKKKKAKTAPKPKKKRVRKWASSDTSEESERSIDFSESSGSENKWKVKKTSEDSRLKVNINKKVLSSDENDEESQASAPKKRPNKIVSDQEEESEEEEGDEEEEEGSSEEEEDEEEEEEEEEDVKASKPEVKDPKAEVKDPKAEVKDPKAEVKDPKAEVKDPKAEVKDPKPEVKAPKPEVKNPNVDAKPSLQVKVPVKPDAVKVAETQGAVKKDSNVSVAPVEPIKEKIVVSMVQDKPPVRTVKKDATKMVPCVIPYDKSPKSGHGTTPDDESDRESIQNTPKPVTYAKSVPQQYLPKTVPKPPIGVITSTAAPPRPVTKTIPVPDRRPFASSIVQPFSNLDEDSDDEVPLERIPTAVPNPLPTKPLAYERETKYTPAKELPGFTYTAPEEKCFPPTYSNLAPFQDYSSRPSPLKPSLVETYNRSSPSKLTPLDSYTQAGSVKGPYPLKPSLVETYNRSSPSKLTSLDSYSQSSSPKGFISLDSYSEARKKKQHFYGNPGTDQEIGPRPPPPPDTYQREIGFPPEPTPFPPSPSTYHRSTPPHGQRDPGTPPRFHSQYPDGYAPPRSPEYYQNSYYHGEERVPRPSYQPNYAPPEHGGPPYVPNPYVATPVPQPNGGFMIDTLLRARNPEDGEDELTGVTDIVSYITQE